VVVVLGSVGDSSHYSIKFGKEVMKEIESLVNGKKKRY